MWVLPFSVTVVCLLDLALFHFYNMNYHPWKYILMEVKSGFRKRPTIRVKKEQKEGKPQKLLSQQAHIFYYSNTKDNQEEIPLEEAHTNNAMEGVQ
jgi:hypothetical protein